LSGLKQVFFDDKNKFHLINKFFVSFNINNNLIVIIVSHKNNHFILQEIKFSFNISLKSFLSSTLSFLLVHFKK